MDPTALLPCRRPHLADRFPEPERAVGHGELWRDRQASGFRVEQPLAPVLCAFAGAVGEADEFLLALRRCADQDEDALLLVIQTRLHVNAVGPHVSVAPSR